VTTIEVIQNDALVPLACRGFYAMGPDVTSAADYQNSSHYTLPTKFEKSEAPERCRVIELKANS
jgi:hypothetical protein